MNEPFLSIVVVSRNDDHGGNLLQRMQLFITGLLEQARTYNLSSELIIVEWNPLPDRPRLAQVLKWPDDTGPCAVRIIEVPPEIHQHFKYADKLPVFQMIGKNVGIRRARGRFILATNIDILFSDALMKFLASGKLSKNRMYRIDRYDVPSEIPDVSINEQLEYCHNNVIRINRRGSTIIFDEETETPPQEDQTSDKKETPPQQDQTSDKNQNENEIDNAPLLHALLKRVKAVKNINHFFRLVRDSIIFLSSFINLRRVFYGAYRMTRSIVQCIIVTPVLYGKILHTNACGDFTLMARKQWVKLRGYVEFQMFSMHLDGLLCFVAHNAGIRELVLKDPMRIYHIEHALGSGFSPGIGVKLMNERLEKAGIPQLSYQDYLTYVKRIRWRVGPKIFNQDINWGLADENLPEMIIGARNT